MSDFERRLRDALHSAAETPPDGLMDAVLRRHGRHQLRLGAGLVAVVAAVVIAVPQLIGVLQRGSSGTGPGIGPVRAHGPLRPGSAAPGTVLDGCTNSNVGQLGQNWKARFSGLNAAPDTFRAGPLWAIPESVQGGSRIGHQPNPEGLRLYVDIVVLDGLKPGTAVVVRSAGPHAGDLRFFYSPHQALSPYMHYSLRSGSAGVTFVSCSRRQQTYPAPYTDYLGAYVVRGPRCVPATVTVSGWSHSYRIRFGRCLGR